MFSVTRLVSPLLLLATAHAAACTLWGAAGTTEGTLLAKNRDWIPDHLQSVRLVHPAHGLSYVGLFAEGSRVPGLKEGVNQAGLTVLSASASSLPRAERDAVHGHHLLSTLLTGYHSLDEVAAAAPTLFKDQHPEFLMLADAHGLMRIEIGLNGHYAMTRTQEGTLAQTNHYLEPDVIDGAQTPGLSSTTRYDRVQALLAANAGPHTLAEFARISADQHDGPDNSLWRSGHEHTLAAWRIALPVSGAPHLQLTLADGGTAGQSGDWVLDHAFWAQPERVLLGMHQSAG